MPFMIVFTFIVKLIHGRPLFFVQPRPRMHGKPLKMYKFLTMTDARDAECAQLLDYDRLTFLGKFFRDTSLDKFKELINLPMGEMSLIGPSSLLMAYLPRCLPEQNRRHDVN